jgi:hypothetical protein
MYVWCCVAFVVPRVPLSQQHGCLCAAVGENVGAPRTLFVACSVAAGRLHNELDGGGHRGSRADNHCGYELQVCQHFEQAPDGAAQHLVVGPGLHQLDLCGSIAGAARWCTRTYGTYLAVALEPPSMLT